MYVYQNFLRLTFFLYYPSYYFSGVVRRIFIWLVKNTEKDRIEKKETCDPSIRCVKQDIENELHRVWIKNSRVCLGITKKVTRHCSGIYPSDST